MPDCRTQYLANLELLSWKESKYCIDCSGYILHCLAYISHSIKRWQHRGSDCWRNTEQYSSTAPGISCSHYPLCSSSCWCARVPGPVSRVWWWWPGVHQCCLCDVTPPPAHTPALVPDWSRPQPSRQPCTAQPSKLKISKNSEEAKLSFPPPPCRKYEVSILINFMRARVRCGQL